MKTPMTPGDAARKADEVFQRHVRGALPAINDLAVAGLEKLRLEDGAAAQLVARAMRAGAMLRMSVSLSTTTKTAWLRCDVLTHDGTEAQLWQVELQREADK